MFKPMIARCSFILFFLLISLSCSTFLESKPKKKLIKQRQTESYSDKIKREKQEIEYERLKRFQTLHDKGATNW